MMYARLRSHKGIISLRELLSQTQSHCLLLHCGSFLVLDSFHDLSQADGGDILNFKARVIKNGQSLQVQIQVAMHS